MSRVLVIGPIFCDLLLDGFQGVPSPGEEEYLDQIRLSIGGGAITALALAQLGITTDLLSSVGDDLFGRYMRDELTKRGIGTALMDVEKDDKSNITVIFPDRGDRSFLTQIMEQDCISPAILNSVKKMDVTAFSHIHITYSLLKIDAYADMIRRASEKDITISADLGYSDAKAWTDKDFEGLDVLDYFFPNDKEAVMMTGSEDMEEAIRIFAQKVTHPVITMGGQGIVLLNENGEFRRVPAPDIPVLNTTGAGDSFTAGFLYGRGCGESLEASALKGTICGSLTAGSRSSVSPHISTSGLRDYLESKINFVGETP